MSRWEFMRRLEELLSDISPSEREEALQYYNDYINDAGRENEEEAIASLGTPEQVAKSVKEGLSESFGMGEFTENGFTSGSAQSANPIVKRTETNTNANANTSTNAGTYTNANAYANNNANTNTYAGNTNGTSGQQAQNGAYTGQTVENTAAEKEKFPAWAIVLIVIGGIVLSPVILGVVGSLFGLIVSVFAAVFGLIVGVAAAAIALFAAGIALVIAGFGGLFVHPLVSIGLIGAGLVCMALSILFVMLEVLLCGICLPGIVKGLIYIFKKLFGKKEVA